MEESVKVTDLAGLIREQYGLPKTDLRMMPSLTLALMGDCVYELVIRSLVVQEHGGSIKDLNRRKVSLVKAEAQAAILHVIEPDLTEEELAVYKRGRNAKTNSTAKNQSLTDYHTATGLEALCGYLYLSGRMDRVLDLVKKGITNGSI